MPGRFSTRFRLFYFMTYSEKLKNPKWQKKTLEILQRDNFTCTSCGNTEKTLHVHHRIYEGQNPWDTGEKYLRTLCEDCHSFEETVATIFKENAQKWVGKSEFDYEWFNHFMESLEDGCFMCPQYVLCDILKLIVINPYFQQSAIAIYEFYKDGIDECEKRTKKTYNIIEEPTPF